MSFSKVFILFNLLILLNLKFVKADLENLEKCFLNPNTIACQKFIESSKTNNSSNVLESKEEKAKQEKEKQARLEREKRLKVEQAKIKKKAKEVALKKKLEEKQ